MEIHYATLWESLADVIGDRPALACGTSRRSWSAYDDRAARLASAFSDAGLKADSKVALYLYNGNEYLEAQFAAFKARAVPINVNYRYLDDELLYILENSDAEIFLFHTSLGDRVERIMQRAPKVKLWVEIDDGGKSVPGAVPYEALLESHEPAARIRRSETDIYMLYTGGTTGMPKGVMYEIGGMLQAFINLGFPMFGLGAPAVREIPALVAKLWSEGRAPISIPTCPLMHGTGMWLGAMIPQCAGATIVTLESRSFDPQELWQVAERERATQLVIVGDAFAKPMLRALEEARDQGRSYDLSATRFIISSGVMWTSEVKQQLLDWKEFVLVDVMGSTEGSVGTQVTTLGNVGETAKFSMNSTTRVFSEDGRELEPGSGQVGMVASGGTVPIGYYKDDARSRATFRTIGGIRYSFAGDWGVLEADGTLTLLGRGSHCINTAGEKVYPEEVEEAVKRHPDVLDCLVVGVDDETFGQRVAGVVSLRPGRDSDAEVLREFARSRLAAFKVPKQIVLVDRIRRGANGKADYAWAREMLDAAPS